LQFLDGTEGMAAIEAENLRIHRQGVTGVPCFMFDDRLAMSGAQDVSVLLKMIDIASHFQGQSPLPPMGLAGLSPLL